MRGIPRWRIMIVCDVFSAYRCMAFFRFCFLFAQRVEHSMFRTDRSCFQMMLALCVCFIIVSSAVTPKCTFIHHAKPNEVKHGTLDVEESSCNDGVVLYRPKDASSFANSTFHLKLSGHYTYEAPDREAFESFYFQATCLDPDGEVVCEDGRLTFLPDIVPKTAIPSAPPANSSSNATKTPQSSQGQLPNATGAPNTQAGNATDTNAPAGNETMVPATSIPQKNFTTTAPSANLTTAVPTLTNLTTSVPSSNSTNAVAPLVNLTTAIPMGNQTTPVPAPMNTTVPESFAPAADNTTNATSAPPSTELPTVSTDSPFPAPPEPKYLENCPSESWIEAEGKCFGVADEVSDDCPANTTIGSILSEEQNEVVKQLVMSNYNSQSFTTIQTGGRVIEAEGALKMTWLNNDTVAYTNFLGPPRRDGCVAVDQDSVWSVHHICPWHKLCIGTLRNSPYHTSTPDTVQPTSTDAPTLPTCQRSSWIRKADICYGLADSTTLQCPSESDFSPVVSAAANRAVVGLLVARFGETSSSCAWVKGSVVHTRAGYAVEVDRMPPTFTNFSQRLSQTGCITVDEQGQWHAVSACDGCIKLCGELAPGVTTIVPETTAVPVSTTGAPTTLQPTTSTSQPSTTAITSTLAPTTQAPRSTTSEPTTEPVTSTAPITTLAPRLTHTTPTVAPLTRSPTTTLHPATTDTIRRGTNDTDAGGSGVGKRLPSLLALVGIGAFVIFIVIASVIAARRIRRQRRLRQLLQSGFEDDEVARVDYDDEDAEDSDDLKSSKKKKKKGKKSKVTTEMVDLAELKDAANDEFQEHV